MQSFGEHGRELITPEVGLRLLDLLGQLGSEMEHSTEAVTPQQKLLQRTVFKVGLQRISAKQGAIDGNACTHLERHTMTVGGVMLASKSCCPSAGVKRSLGASCSCLY